MRAGKLRNSIILKRRSLNVSELGEHSIKYSVIGIRRGSRVQQSANELQISIGEGVEITTRIKLRYDRLTSSLNEADRLNIDGKDYDIKSINNMMEKNRELVFTCINSERQSNG